MCLFHCDRDVLNNVLAITCCEGLFGVNISIKDDWAELPFENGTLDFKWQVQSSSINISTPEDLFQILAVSCCLQSSMRGSKVKTAVSFLRVIS